MSASRHNAPLVELVAEVRWDPLLPAKDLTKTGFGGPMLFTGDSAELERDFARFSLAADRLGYGNIERLSPEGFPLLAHQPVVRHRALVGPASSIYQIGPGVFSANAVPPYQSWDAFAPVVRAGIEALLNSRSEKEREQPFFATSLRYIDAFGAEFTRGQSNRSFLEDVLGIKISLPPALTQNIGAEGEPKASLQLQLPMPNGMLMSFGLGEGLWNGAPALMMDTAVATTVQIGADVDSVMSAFHMAHEVIRSSFGLLTAPIAHLMPFKGE